MKDTAELFIDSRCELGEGVFWHPLQERLFWFDILNKTLFSATAGGIMVDRFTFEATVTAAGVIDEDNLAIASAAGIFRLNLKTDARELLVTEIDMARSEHVRRIWPFLRDRRIDAYGDLLKRFRD